MIRLNNKEERDLRELVALAFQAVNRFNEMQDAMWDQITQGGDAAGALIIEHSELKTFSSRLEHAAEKLDFCE